MSVSAIEVQLTVERLLARYVHAIDAGELEAWPMFFTEQGRYRITTAENVERDLPISIMDARSRSMLRDRVAALRHANIYEDQRYRHVVSSTLVEPIDNATVRATSNFMVMRIMHDGASMVFASGRYLDRIVLSGEEGRPQFDEKLVICDSRRFDTLLAIPL